MGGFLFLVKYLFFSKESPGPAAIQFGSVDKKANGESDADIFLEKRVQVEKWRGARVDFLIFALSLAHRCISDRNWNNSSRTGSKI